MSNSNPYDVTQDPQGNPISPDEAVPERPLKQIGRYRINKELGRGGFGLVYLAYDEQLKRLVAIKVPHAKLISSSQDAEAYLTEARTVANLDHPHIVPVFDVGNTEDCPCYVVSKYIEGTDLSTKLKQHRLKYREAAELVATVAEALHYAHMQGVVHRDVKPGNILIGQDGQPFVVDFGLALREEDIGKGPIYAGTPAYMSPEQARGEGHRVDGRSDIFSLGILFYEALIGRQPFRGDTPAELFEQVTSYEAKPLRQYDDKIPKELERICHKAMAKRASERYSTAKDFGDDLRYFLAEQTLIQSDTSPGGLTLVEPRTGGRQGRSAAVDSISSSRDVKFGSSNSQPIKIIPKGLRSFDAHDADFFLELLPGPRDRHGLPDSLRFWKTRIEEPDPDNSFSVGLIYGPSGCGKSSLVKAGLLPRLSEDVIPVYIEATPEETETRLLQGLRKRCPILDDKLNLKDTLAALRRGRGIPVERKVLIILDQFEQWLHASNEEENTDLVQALRQCDGGRVQCIVMVRDDFWMAVTRFLRELEVKLLEDHNLAAVDLFPEQHADKVLTAFGRAFGTLPDNLGDTAKQHQEFIKQSVAGLAEEGKVICVRLALFAEMMKGKAWTPETLKKVGGTSGVGVTFLDEMFSSSSASPRHRLHQKAARAVLQNLLPDSGTDIKGHMRSHADLLEASGYGNRLKDFDDLIRILDSEIRLITPTDPEGKDVDNDSVTQPLAGQKYFQLTHDYLVHSLREWLTRKQKETRKGRAELKLFDTSATWNAKPENRFLPSWWEHLTIRLLTDRTKWTEPQRKMMSQSTWLHGLRTLLLLFILFCVGYATVSIRRSIVAGKQNTRAREIVESLPKAEIAQVPSIVSNLEGLREWANAILKVRIEAAEDGSPLKLHLSLALLPVDPTQVEYLSEQLTVCTLDQFPVLRDALLPYRDQIIERMWALVEDHRVPQAERFQAAAALATFSPDEARWEQIAPFVTQYLTSSVSTVVLGSWLDYFGSASQHLADSLAMIHSDRNLSPRKRESAALGLAQYWSDHPVRLVSALLVADELDEFSPIVDSLKPHAAEIEHLLQAEMKAEMPAQLDNTNDQLSDEEEQRRDAHLKRQAQAAVALVHLGYAEDVWPLLEFTPNPSLRSFVINLLGKLGTNHNALAGRLKVEVEVSIRRALIQSLGGLEASQIPTSDRNRIVDQLKALYVNHPDSGIHSSASWTLRKWNETLPELPIGQPTLSKEQKQRIVDLRKLTEETNTKIGRERLKRIAEWGTTIFKENQVLPPSTGGSLRFHYGFDNLDAGNNTTSQNPRVQLHGDTKPETTKGVVGQAVELRDGAYATGDLLKIDTEKPFSIGGWFLFKEKRRGAGLLSNRDKNNHLQGVEIFHLRSGQFQFHFGGQTGYLACSTQDNFDDTNCWYHIVVTYDGTKTVNGIQIYVNGKSRKLIPETETHPLESESIESPVPLHFGTRPIGLFSFTPLQGAIDEIRFHDQRLTDTEIERIYLNRIGKISSESHINPGDEFEGTLLLAASERQPTILRDISPQLEANLAGLESELLDLSRRWYVNAQGQTMVVIPNPAELGIEQIDHSYSISSHEVTVAEFLRFAPGASFDSVLSQHLEVPVLQPTWYEATAYCNWLSELEGIPEDQWVYVPNASGKYGAGMAVRDNFDALAGYRLPTEDEWEYAARAESLGTYSFGEPVGLIPDFAWFAGNSSGQTQRVELLQPNEFGLFDMHGNVYEFTQYSNGGLVSASRTNGNCVARGGSFLNQSAYLEPTHEGLVYMKNFRSGRTGFRPCRTYELLD